MCPPNPQFASVKQPLTKFGLSDSNRKVMANFHSSMRDLSVYDLLLCIDTHSCSLTGDLVISQQGGKSHATTLEEVRSTHMLNE